MLNFILSIIAPGNRITHTSIGNYQAAVFFDIIQQVPLPEDTKGCAPVRGMQQLSGYLGKVSRGI